MIRRAILDHRAEDGSVLVFVALGLPVLIAVFLLVVDVGNWFVHKRSLQNEVDAAAFAGSGLWGDCFSGDPVQAFIDMKTEASKYSGTGGSPQYNPQIGDASSKGTLSMLYNSPLYASGGPASDPTFPSSACDPPYLFDVKGTEANVPILFSGLLPGFSLAQLNAHARLQLKQAQTFSHLAPLAVPTPNPNFVFASFVDEATGNPPAGCAAPCEIELYPSGTSGGIQMWALDGSVGSVALSFGVPARLGVRLRLVGGLNKTATCGQVLVDCYDAGSANGVVFIRGWDGSAAAPNVQDISLLGAPTNACSPDAYFASASCSAGISADIDLGPTHPLTGTQGETATVTASVDGGSPITLTPGSGTGLVTWSLPSGLTLSGTGPHTVSLAWTWSQTSGTRSGHKCTNKNSNPCTDDGDFGGTAFQRAFVADPTRSGPVQLVQVYQPGVTSSGSNTFKAGTTPAGGLAVTVGTLGPPSVQSQASDPPVQLRVTADVHGQTQSIDCDPKLPNIRDEIVSGCAPRYTINTGTPCVFNPDPQPWNCVSIQTGNAPGQVDQGLSTRIGSTCGAAPNNWPDWKVGDTRIFPVFLTPFNTFTGSGNGLVPVIGAATFYVTAWNGDPCLTAAQYPTKGSIIGHFIAYASPDPGGASDKPCDPTKLIPCVPVLTQ